MGKKLVSRTAKVLSETKRLKEKEAVAIAYEHIPRNPEEQKHGSLYAVIELEDTAGHAEEIADRIIDVLHNEYYDNCSRDPLTCFESALAKINEDLTERSSEGQINWIGKLNAILAVLTDNTLHLTQTGRAEAYLYRNEHAMHVTEDMAGDAINPLRTFMNIASGDLTENDRVVFVTPGVFYKISKSELKKYATDSTPKQAAENLSRILSGENGTTLPNAILLMEMVSPEAFAAESVPETETWVKEEKNFVEPIAEETLTGAVKAFDVVGRAFAGASAVISAKAVPTTKKLVEKLKDFHQVKSAGKIILDSEEKLAASHNLDLEVNENILETPKETSFDREIRIQESTKPRILSIERFDFTFLKKAKKFTPNIKPLKLPRGKYSIAYLAIGALILVGFFSYIGLTNAEKGRKVAAENTFNQAKTKYEEALTELQGGQRTAALENLNVAEKLASDAKQTKYKADEAGALLSEISKTREEAMGVVKNTAQLYADFGGKKVEGFYSDGVTFYGVNFDNGSIYSLDPKSKMVATLAENTMTEKIKFGTYSVSRKTFIFYTESKNVYEVTISSKKALKQAISGGEWEDAVAIASYLSNIYLLSPNEGQIYKHQKTSSGYGKKTAYFSTTADIADATSLAIDSNIFITTTNGVVSKYTSGTKQAFEVKGMPQNPDGVKIVYADPTVKGVYLTTGDSVIKLDENGNFVAQYKSDQIKNVTGIVVDDETSSALVLSDNKIYLISY